MMEIPTTKILDLPTNIRREDGGCGNGDDIAVIKVRKEPIECCAEAKRL
jgi:hypothetical protein